MPVDTSGEESCKVEEGGFLLTEGSPNFTELYKIAVAKCSYRGKSMGLGRV